MQQFATSAGPRFSQASPDVTVIVVNYNTAHLLPRLFDSLNAGRNNLKLQIIVVENASRDRSAETLRQYPDIEIINNPVNVGFARANNQAVSHARGRYVLLLNTDAFMSHDTLPKTIEYMESNPGCGVLGVRLVGENGTLQPSCRYFPTPWNVFLSATGLAKFFPKTRLVDDLSWDHASLRQCDWVPGCYYLVRREVIDTVGLFDPRYFLYCEEVDHCRAVRRAGWNVVYYPYTSVVHIGGESAISEGGLDSERQVSPLFIESELLYFRKHYGILGVLAAAGLSVLSDVMKMCLGLFCRFDSKKVTSALRHTSMVLSRLIATGCASRATR